MRIAILRNEDPESSKKWEISCQKANVEYSIIDLTSNEWFDEISKIDAHIFVLKPPGETFKFKNLYDERLYVVTKIMGKFTFPSLNEVIIYENKRMLATFLKASEISMPDTWVFYNKGQANIFAENVKLPIVAKTGIGASGTGVKIIRKQKDLNLYIKTAFGKGIKRRLGPNRTTGSIKTWTKKAFISPSFLLKKIRKYIEVYQDTQKGFVILQEYIPHDYEWRVIRIGDSWFGHQKIKQGDKASGSKGINYVTPPLDLMDFCREICEKHEFLCMALDVFEHPTKGYVINELQTIFGHVQHYLMEVDGKPGRYVYQNEKWIFEEGDFNTNESYDLRLKTAISLYAQTV
jgi:glutathione synthase/RimK-type ligase-like ATP-grasp enzyme